MARICQEVRLGAAGQFGVLLGLVQRGFASLQRGDVASDQHEPAFRDVASAETQPFPFRRVHFTSRFRSAASTSGGNAALSVIARSPGGRNSAEPGVCHDHPAVRIHQRDAFLSPFQAPEKPLGSPALGDLASYHRLNAVAHRRHRREELAAPVRSRGRDCNVEVSRRDTAGGMQGRGDGADHVARQDRGDECANEQCDAGELDAPNLVPLDQGDRPGPVVHQVIGDRLARSTLSLAISASAWLSIAASRDAGAAMSCWLKVCQRPKSSTTDRAAAA